MLTRSPLRSKISAMLVVAFFLAAAFLAGCKKDSTTAPADQTVTATDDAADAVSDGLASNNGGAMDQVNDVLVIAGDVGLETLGKTGSDTSIVVKQYDTTTASWTMTVIRQRSVLPLYFGYWTRNYWHQFRANGKPQKFRLTGGVAADTIKHQLLSGTGYFWTPRLVHHLTGIQSNWTASNTNTDTVTINGTYSRSGVDTIKTLARAGRVISQSLTLNFINVKGPRGSRLNRSEKTSGTIQGTWTATVSAPGKTTFSVTKTFTIILGGGTATYTIDGTAYVRDLATGDPV